MLSRGHIMSMRVKTWKILDKGSTALDSDVELECVCGNSAMLPVRGTPIAQVGLGLVFDLGPRDMPRKIQCRRCGRVLELCNQAAA